MRRHQDQIGARIRPQSAHQIRQLRPLRLLLVHLAPGLRKQRAQPGQPRLVIPARNPLQALHHHRVRNRRNLQLLRQQRHPK
jgi:hypothetical protein